jgi:hypothetical protein
VKRQWALHEVFDVVRASGGTNAVLIGGQAIGYWAERYSARSPALTAFAPFTSSDIDFQGTPEDARRFAAAVHAENLQFPKDGHDTTNVASMFVPVGTETVLVQFLTSPFGTRGDQTSTTAIPVDAPDGFAFRVQHPVLALEGRIANLVALPGRDAEREARMAHAGIVCVREFIRDMASQQGARPALNLIKRVFRFALEDRNANSAFTSYGIDCMEAVEPLAELPAEFRTTGYPKMLEQIERGRRQRPSEQK